MLLKNCVKWQLRKLIKSAENSEVCIRINKYCNEETQKGKSVKLLKYYIKYATYHCWILKFNCRWKEQEKNKKDGSHTHLYQMIQVV